ncbi:MAG: flavodoxin domain-containing protein [Clostridiales bacterium]|jgi:flavodoxin short chain|nr:flavodoxin domain-containing protein [Clostridiales bacterium]
MGAKVAVIYWSRGGSTEQMAKAVAAGLKESGVDADLFKVSEVDSSVADKYNGFALGCPAMGKEVLEEKVFEPFFASIEKKLKGKDVALFGAYGWGDGKWMREWTERAEADGAKVLKPGLIVKTSTDFMSRIKQAFGKEQKIDQKPCLDYGRKLAERFAKGQKLHNSK